jgi:hypothetical protein
MVGDVREYEKSVQYYRQEPEIAGYKAVKSP